jgi:hypothetical protein
MEQLQEQTKATQVGAKTEWLVEGLIPKRHRNIIVAPERGCKTMNTCALAVCVAAGEPYLGLNVEQGTTVIVDQETPPADLKKWLVRFSMGLGRDYNSLPIVVYDKETYQFRFDRKTCRDWLVDKLEKIKKDSSPIKLITFDSMIALLPSGRQGIVENDSTIGKTLQDEFDTYLQVAKEATIMMSAHAKKEVAAMMLKDIKAAEMVSMVRGHGSIVGEGCDTGFAIKKLCEAPRDSKTTYAIIPKPGRSGIPIPELYVALEEEKYMEGWAKLKQIEAVKQFPPLCLEVLRLIFAGEGKTEGH